MTKKTEQLVDDDGNIIPPEEVVKRKAIKKAAAKKAKVDIKRADKAKARGAPSSTGKRADQSSTDAVNTKNEVGSPITETKPVNLAALAGADEPGDIDLSDTLGLPEKDLTPGDMQMVPRDNFCPACGAKIQAVADIVVAAAAAVDDDSAVAAVDDDSATSSLSLNAGTISVVGDAPFFGFTMQRHDTPKYNRMAADELAGHAQILLDDIRVSGGPKHQLVVNLNKSMPGLKGNPAAMNMLSGQLDIPDMGTLEAILQGLITELGDG